MADKTLESLVGGDGLMMLAPDLDFIANKSSESLYAAITFNPSLNPVVLSLSGKFYVGIINISGFTAITPISIILTIDGVVIWNSAMVGTASGVSLLGAFNAFVEPIKCNESLTLQIFQAGDTSATLYYLARPIL